MPTLNVAAAKLAGASDQDIQDFISKNPGIEVGGGAQQQSDFSSLLPVAGGIAGGLAGEVGGPVGGVVGAGLGQAGGQALSDILGGKPIGGDVLQQGVQGAGAGIFGLGIGKLAGGILGKFGEDTAMAGVNATGLQKANYLADHGETMGQTLLTHNLAGADAGVIQSKAIDPLAQSYNDVANNPTSGISISPEHLADNVGKQYQQLIQYPTADNQAIAGKLYNEWGNIVNKYGNGPIPMSDLNKFKQAFDARTSNFDADQIGVKANRTIGNVLRQTVNEAADRNNVQVNGMPLGQAGQELSKLMDLRDIAAKREFTGGSPFTFKNMAEGYGLGAMSGLGPIAGFAGATGLNLAMRQPAIASGVAKAALGGAALSKVGGIPAGVAAGGLLGSVLPAIGGQGNNQNNTNNQASNTQGGANIAQGGQSVNGWPDQLPSMDVNTAIQQSYPAQQYMQDLHALNNEMANAQGDPIQMENIQRQIDIAGQIYSASKDQAASYLSAHQLDPGQLSFIQSSPNTYNQMQQLRDLITKLGPNGVTPLNEVGPVSWIKSLSNPDYAQMLSLMTTMRGSAVKSLEGGRPSNYDQQTFANSMPGPADSYQSALAKLDLAKNILIKNYTRLLPYATMSTAQSAPGVIQSTPAGFPSQAGAPMMTPDQVAQGQAIFGQSQDQNANPLGFLYNSLGGGAQ